MEEETKVEVEVVPTATEPSEKEKVEAELEKVEASKRTKLEKLEYTKSRVDAQIAEEKAKAGETPDDDRPLTVREFKAMQQQTAQETALSLADSIENEAERKLVKHHLENTIKPSGDPQTDLKNARLIVNSVKNGQIVEETLRSVKARPAGSTPSAPPKETTKAELTIEERTIMRGFGLTEAEVLAQRPTE